jgi:hypothetical protein
VICLSDVWKVTSCELGIYDRRLQIFEWQTPCATSSNPFRTLTSNCTSLCWFVYRTAARRSLRLHHRCFHSLSFSLLVLYEAYGNHRPLIRNWLRHSSATEWYGHPRVALRGTGCKSIFPTTNSSTKHVKNWRYFSVVLHTILHGLFVDSGDSE